jgi:hypothetical protein
MVINRSLRLSIIRVAIIAGTLHPKPMKSGIKDFPCKPILCISLSIIKTALAIYPVSSIKDIKRKRIIILGRKTITPPTPPIIASARKSLTIPGGNKPEIIPERLLKPISIHDFGYPPSLNVVKNVSHMKKTKIGIPRYL